MAGKSKEPLLVKGKRLDGRKPAELRKITAEVGVIEKAVGSAKFTMGETVAVASVYGPIEVHPRHKEKSDRAILKVNYAMLPFSTSDRCRPGPSRRSKEISKVISESLEASLLLHKYPARMFEIDVVILNANAGTRTAAINAASLACADAGIEMRDLVCSVAAGKAEDTVLLDLFQPEDNYGQADLPMAVLPNLGEISLVQMDGDLSLKEFDEGFDMILESAKELYEIQKKALMEKKNE